MIVLTKYLNQPNFIYATPYELANEIDFPYYIFIFRNRLTGEVIQMGLENISATFRFQVFQLDVYPFNNSANFETNNNGFYTYEIYGSIDGVEIETEILETGFMLLKNDDKYEPTKYNEQDNTFITYNAN